MKKSTAEHALFIFNMIEMEAWDLQKKLIGRPEFAAQVEALDTIIYASTQARAALQMESVPDQLEDHIGRR